MNLLDFRRNVASQTGEDGIVEKIFEVLDIRHGTCVEFGAWDGKYFSNTWNLITNHGWSAVMIEGSRTKFQELQQTYAGNPQVTCVNRMVGVASPDSLDDILAKTPLPTDFDFLSIDVDGNDIHILRSLQRYRPKVFVIEFNPTMPNHLVFEQPCDPKIHHGSSLFAIKLLGKKMGYEMIASTDWNGFFVDRTYYPRFDISDNTLPALRRNHDYETNVLQMYDGTLMFSGNTRMLWHGGIPMDEEKLQVLPPELRVFPDSQD